MRVVQPLITTDQAELVAAALRDAEKALAAAGHPADLGGEPEVQEDIAALGRLSMLFQDASENPAKYPPAPKVAASLKQFRTRITGEAQPSSNRKRRAGRSQRRRALRHHFRRNREYVEQYNKARGIAEAEQKEHEANVAEIAKRVEDQPKFTITDGFGNVVMAGVPAEFIKNGEGNAPFAPDGAGYLPPKKLIVTGRTE